jgi:hypothetical protein
MADGLRAASATRLTRGALFGGGRGLRLAVVHVRQRLPVEHERAAGGFVRLVPRFEQVEAGVIDEVQAVQVYVQLHVGFHAFERFGKAR